MVGQESEGGLLRLNLRSSVCAPGQVQPSVNRSTSPSSLGETRLRGCALRSGAVDLRSRCLTAATVLGAAAQARIHRQRAGTRPQRCSGERAGSNVADVYRNSTTVFGRPTGEGKQRSEAEIRWRRAESQNGLAFDSMPRGQIWGLTCALNIEGTAEEG